MKGIILAGGNGTRLYPMTLPVTKQLLPVYDKPMIYYPLSVLMQAGVRDVLIISTKQDLPRIEGLLGSGKQLGLNFTYKIQEKPRGIAEAFVIGEDFISDDEVFLILGDNIFFGHSLKKTLQEVVNRNTEAVIFSSYVRDPSRYGVIEFDENDKVISIEEKPTTPKSNFAQTGLYYYKKNASKYSHELSPSGRGELEVTDLNKRYLKQNQLSVVKMGRGFVWMDAGTVASLNDASEFVRVVEKREGLKIGCIEEIAYEMGYINKKQLLELAEPLKKSDYGKYLVEVSKKNYL